MTGRKIKRTVILSRQPTQLLKEMLDAFVCGLHPPVLIRAHHEVRLQAPTGGQELEEIGPSISDMDAHARLRRGTNRLDTLVPASAFLASRLRRWVRVSPLGAGMRMTGC